MYKYIYFDLDGTLIKDNVITGRAEILEDGLEKYKKLCNMYPDSRKILFTNRDRDQIKYPSIYTFDEVLSRGDMEEYIKENIGKITFKDLLSFRNIYLYILGLMLYRNGSTPKLLYLFLKNVLKKERIFVLDDDKRVSGMFKDVIFRA